MKVDRVFKFGCRAPKEPELAEQMLGQAWLYREDLRRVFNENKRSVRMLIASGDDASHVLNYEHELLNARIREKRSVRGHLIDAGTYWLIEADILRASKANKLDPIRQQLFDGTGRIGAAIQSIHQFPVSDWPLNKNKRVQLSEPNEKKHALLTIFVGEMSDRRSVSWPIKLHRDWPEDAIVKQVAVQCTRTGHRFRWTAIVTLCYEKVRERSYAPGSVVAVDIGWRNEAERGLRVATHDAADDTGELFVDVLTDSTNAHGKRMSDFLRSDSVRAIRDDLFDIAKEYVTEKELPGAEFARLWKNKDRLRRLLPLQDEEVQRWHERDKHLEDIECGQRSRGIRRRLDSFRRYADKLAKAYQYLALEDMPIEKWVGKGATRKLERQRSAAALGLLQLILIQRFGADRVDWVPSTYSSTTCSECGVVRSESVGPAVYWQCECGKEHHQDVNAARILRARCERWIGEENPLRARKRKAAKKGPKPGERDIAKKTRKKVMVTSRKGVSEAAE